MPEIQKHTAIRLARCLHNAVDFSLPCFPVYPIRGLTGILLLLMILFPNLPAPFPHWEYYGTHVFKQSRPIEQKPTTFPAKSRGFFAVDGELKRFGLHLAAGKTAERAERKTNYFPGVFAGGGGEKPDG